MNPVGSQVDPLAFVFLDKYSTPHSVAGLQQHEIHTAFLKLVSQVWSLAYLLRLFLNQKWSMDQEKPSHLNEGNFFAKYVIKEIYVSPLNSQKLQLVTRPDGLQRVLTRLRQSLSLLPWLYGNVTKLQR